MGQAPVRFPKSGYFGVLLLSLSTEACAFEVKKGNVIAQRYLDGDTSAPIHDQINRPSGTGSGFVSPSIFSAAVVTFKEVG